MTSQSRFISEDPLGLVAGPNVYAYANNDRLNAIDPLGLVTIYGVPPDAVRYSLNGQTFYAPPNANFQTVFNTGTGGGSSLKLGRLLAKAACSTIRETAAAISIRHTQLPPTLQLVIIWPALATLRPQLTELELYALFNSSNYLSSYFNGGGNANYWSQAVGAANAGVFPTPVSKCGQ